MLPSVAKKDKSSISSAVSALTAVSRTASKLRAASRVIYIMKL